MPVHIDCQDPPARARGIRAAVAALRRGDLVVLPTEAVYGLAADAFSQRGVDALRAAKGRGRDLPLPVLVGRPRTLDGLVAGLSDTARALVEAFWPGPLTVLARPQPTLAWDLGGPADAVAVRMPLHPVALDVLRETGPLAVTGANLAGLPAPIDCESAERQLGAMVAVYLDAGPCPDPLPSSIVDVTTGAPVLVRAGAYSAAVLREVAPDLSTGPEVMAASDPGPQEPGEGSDRG